MRGITRLILAAPLVIGGLVGLGKATPGFATTTPPPDTSAPTSQVYQQSPTKTFYGWNQTSVRVYISASDPDDAVSTIWAAVDNSSCSPSSTASCTNIGANLLAGCSTGGAYCSYGSSIVVSGEGVHTVYYFSQDTHSNIETRHTYTVQIDLTPPTVGVTLTNASGTYTPGTWSRTPVNVSWTLADPTSGGVSSGLDPNYPCNASTVNDNGAGSSLTCSTYDQAGNNTWLPTGTIKVDSTPPTVNCSPSSDAPSWHASDETVVCSSSDSGSGLANPSDASFNLVTSATAGTEQQWNTPSRTVCDVAGNCTTVGPIGPFNIDLKAPAVSCAAADGFWHSDNVAIACTGADYGSGLQNPNDSNFTVSTQVPSGSETSSASTATHQVCDAVGNCSTAGPVGGNMIDRKAPLVTCTYGGSSIGLSGAIDASWHGNNVGVICASTDGGSGLVNPVSDGSFSLSTNLPAGGVSDSAATGSRQVCDNVGNCTSVGPFTAQIDRVAPQVTCGAADSAWHGSDQSVACTASDTGSGLAISGDSSFRLSTHVAAGTTTTNAYTTAHQVCDAVGNCTTGGPIGPFKIDKKSPSVTFATPAANGVYLLGAAVSPSYVCNSAGPPLTSCNGSVTRSGCSAIAGGSVRCTDPAGTLYTGTLGPKTFSVSLTDGVNVTQASQNYTVSDNVCPGYSGALSAAAGGPITVFLCNAAGQAVTSPPPCLTSPSHIPCFGPSSYPTLTAVKLVKIAPENKSFPLNNPFACSQVVSSSSCGRYSLTLKGYTPGNYLLYFTLTGDPPGYAHSVAFTFGP